MAVTFQKIGESGISIFWDNELELCGSSNYRYIYRLFKDSIIYNTVGPTTEFGYTWFGLPAGSYRVTVTSEYEAFGPGSGWFECTTYDTSFEFANIIISAPLCIPANATNISFSALAKFYGLDVDSILLSGPNNPSTTGSIFGNSDLPSTGTISKSRPNAVSELRGACGGAYPWADVISDPTPDRVVIVGNAGVILHSTNGTTWNLTYAPGVSGNLVGVSSGLEYRFAVGDNGRLIKSPEGVFWSVQNSGVGSQSLIDCDRLVEGGNVFSNLFVGTGGVIRHSNSNDLSTWAIRTSGTTESLTCVRYILFAGITAIIVGGNGTILTSNSTNYDGWTSRTSGTTQFLNSVDYVNTTLIVVGNGGTVRTSTNAGVSWTSRTFGSTANIRGLCVGVIGGTNRLVAVCSLGVIRTSDDSGTTWTARTSGTTTQFNSVIFYKGLFIAVGLNGMIRTSPDGITWTDRTSGTTQNLNDVKIYKEIIV